MLVAAPRGAFARTPPNHSKRDAAPWALDEDQLILEMVAVFGRRWQAIASHLPRRTDNAVRNRFERLVAGARHAVGAADPVRRYLCTKCGRWKRGHVCTARRNAGVQVPWAIDPSLDDFWQELREFN